MAVVEICTCVVVIAANKLAQMADTKSNFPRQVAILALHR